MLLWLLILFVTIPVLESVVLIVLWQATSFSTTVLIVLATGFLGAGLARWQGVQAIRRLREQYGRQQVPTLALVDGVFIFLAGILLLTPGLISDTCGFLLLIPPVRRWTARRVIQSIRRRIEAKIASIRRASAGRNDEEIIDVEFHRRDPAALDAEHSEGRDTAH